jgi:hypothetical protein
MVDPTIILYTRLGPQNRALLKFDSAIATTNSSTTSFYKKS